MVIALFKGYVVGFFLTLLFMIFICVVKKEDRKFKQIQDKMKEDISKSGFGPSVFAVLMTAFVITAASGWPYYFYRRIVRQLKGVKK